MNEWHEPVVVELIAALVKINSDKNSGRARCNQSGGLEFLLNGKVFDGFI